MRPWMPAATLALVLGSCGRPPAPQPAAHTEKEPKEAGHSSRYIEEAGVVELSLEAQKRVGLEVRPVALGEVELELVAPGTVIPMDTRIGEVRPLAHGRLLQVFVKVGDRVEPQQVLARFDNIEAGELRAQADAARAELQKLKIQHGQAERQAERSRSLVSIGAVPAREAESAEAEAKALAEAIRAQQSTLDGVSARLRRFGIEGGAPADSITSLRSPFRGVIVRMGAAPGDVVEPSSMLFSVADLSRVYVEAQVYEKDLGRIRPGQPAFVSFEAYPGRRFPARVAVIKDILDPRTRTAGVRCEVANPDGKLRLEMFATVALPTTATHQGLVVPYDAIQTINRRQVVFVRQDELHFEARPVKALGEGAQVEIVAGLKPGEPVVMKGAFHVKSVFLARELKSEHGEHD